MLTNTNFFKYDPEKGLMRIYKLRDEELVKINIAQASRYQP